MGAAFVQYVSSSWFQIITNSPGLHSQNFRLFGGGRKRLDCVSWQGENARTTAWMQRSGVPEVERSSDPAVRMLEPRSAVYT